MVVRCVRVQGVEMEADFEGELHDLDVDRNANDEEDDEEGDDDRIEQQMGDTGEQDTRVDEKLWDDEEEEGGGEADEQQRERKEEYDDKGTIQVDDKRDLDYEVSGDPRTECRAR